MNFQINSQAILSSSSFFNVKISMHLELRNLISSLKRKRVVSHRTLFYERNKIDSTKIFFQQQIQGLLHLKPP